MEYDDFKYLMRLVDSSLNKEEIDFLFSKFDIDNSKTIEF